MATFEQAIHDMTVEGTSQPPEFYSISVVQDSPWYIGSNTSDGPPYHQLTSTDMASALAEADDYLQGTGLVRVIPWRGDMGQAAAYAVWVRPAA